MGKPYNGVIYEIMKKTRYSYHYVVRRLKKDKINIQKQRLVENLSDNTTFWNQISEINSISKSLPSIVDKAEVPPKFPKFFKTNMKHYIVMCPQILLN